MELVLKIQFSSNSNYHNKRPKVKMVKSIDFRLLKNY